MDARKKREVVMQVAQPLKAPSNAPAATAKMWVPRDRRKTKRMWAKEQVRMPTTAAKARMKPQTVGKSNMRLRPQTAQAGVVVRHRKKRALRTQI